MAPCIFESWAEGVVIRALKEEIVTGLKDVFALSDSNNANQKVGSTGMKKTRSRSHSVFRLVLESRASGAGVMAPKEHSSYRNSKLTYLCENTHFNIYLF